MILRDGDHCSGDGGARWWPGIRAAPMTCCGLVELGVVGRGQTRGRAARRTWTVDRTVQSGRRDDDGCHRTRSSYLVGDPAGWIRRMMSCSARKGQGVVDRLSGDRTDTTGRTTSATSFGVLCGWADTARSTASRCAWPEEPRSRSTSARSTAMSRSVGQISTSQVLGPAHVERVHARACGGRLAGDRSTRRSPSAGPADAALGTS